MANGSSINRLYVSGTRHALALFDDDLSVPPAVKRFWAGRPWDDELWGDFYVCARKRYVLGHMQHVRIVRARRTVQLKVR